MRKYKIGGLFDRTDLETRKRCPERLQKLCWNVDVHVHKRGVHSFVLRSGTKVSIWENVGLLTSTLTAWKGD